MFTVDMVEEVVCMCMCVCVCVCVGGGFTVQSGSTEVAFLCVCVCVCLHFSVKCVRRFVEGACLDGRLDAVRGRDSRRRH